MYFLGHGPHLVRGNDGSAYQLSGPLRVPSTHRGEHTQVEDICVRHLRCLRLPCPALLGTEIINELGEGCILMRPGLVALNGDMAVFVLLSWTDKVENCRKDQLLEYEEQRALRILLSTFIRSSNATINKTCVSFLTNRILWGSIGVRLCACPEQ